MSGCAFGGRGGYPEEEIARFGGMLVFAVCPQGDALCQMPIGEVGFSERERHFATFPCGNGDALKTFEFANGARKTPYQVAEVELRHCDCLDVAGIGNRTSGGNRISATHRQD